MADFDVLSRRLTVYSGCQAPHRLRRDLARLLGLPESHVRVVIKDVGGAFGQKIPTQPEDVAVALASMAIGRPVKWIEDRRENFLAAPQSRGQSITVDVALNDDLSLSAFRARLEGDAGAYSFNSASALTEAYHGALVLPGPYNVRGYAYHVTIGLTNRAPIAPYRGVGFVGANVVRELAIEGAARELAIDPDSIRQASLFRNAQMPQTSILGWSLTDSTFEECLSVVRDKLRGFPDPPPGFVRGVAACPYVEPTAIGSQGGYELEGGSVPSHDAARVTIGPDGSVNASFGTPSIGQGLETTMAQVVADELGVATDVVMVTWGDTDQAPISLTGARASRSAAVSGGALRRAAQQLRERLVRVAAEMLEAAEEDVRIIDGFVSVAGIDAQKLSWSELVGHVFTGNPRALGSESLDVTSTYDPPATYSNGAVGAIVDVNEGTGAVVLRALFGAEDCGQAINPLVVEGQFVGGAVQGVGGILHEAIEYSATEQPITTTLMDYRLPTASDVPRLQLTHIQGSENPPIKGVGESGTIGASAAVACALADALALRGGEVNRLPMLPYGAWEAMQNFA